jgi:hypothetical protein
MCSCGIVLVHGREHTIPEPKTLQEAIVYFGDPDRCFEYAKKMRWPDGVIRVPALLCG